MDSISSLFSGQILRRLFGGTDALLERRVRNLPVAVDRRRGPRCENCGFGTLHAIPSGERGAGMLRCDRPGCGHVFDGIAASAAECVIRAS